MALPKAPKPPGRPDRGTTQPLVFSRDEFVSCAFGGGTGDASFLIGMWFGVVAVFSPDSRSGPSHRNPPFDPKLGILLRLPESTPTYRSRAHDSMDEYTSTRVAPLVFRLFPVPLQTRDKVFIHDVLKGRIFL